MKKGLYVPPAGYTHRFLGRSERRSRKLLGLERIMVGNPGSGSGQKVANKRERENKRKRDLCEDLIPEIYPGKEG